MWTNCLERFAPDLASLSNCVSFWFITTTSSLLENRQTPTFRRPRNRQPFGSRAPAEFALGPGPESPLPVSQTSASAFGRLPSLKKRRQLQPTPRASPARKQRLRKAMGAMGRWMVLGAANRGLCESSHWSPLCLPATKYLFRRFLQGHAVATCRQSALLAEVRWNIAEFLGLRLVG